MAGTTQERKTYPADKARQGEIVLNTKMRRLVFFGGWISVGLALLALPFILAAL